MDEISPIPRVRPGRGVLATSINRLRDAAVDLSRRRPCGGGLKGIDVAGTPQVYKDRPPTFHARVALSGSGPAYMFSEVYGVRTSAIWAAYPGGRSGSNAYELNGKPVDSGAVVELHPVGGGAWYWFLWKSKPGSGGGGTGSIGSIDGCFCTSIPAVLTMTSTSSTCNYGMFQSCTIEYQAPPDWAGSAGLDLGDMIYMSNESFEDTAAEAANPDFGPVYFYYYLTCSYNVFYLYRIYETSPYGSPYISGVLYAWYIGSAGNTCGTDSLVLSLGSYFGTGGDGVTTCCVTIYGGTATAPGTCNGIGISFEGGGG